MEKKTALILKIIYGFIIVGTIISITIVKNDVYNNVSKIFIIGYLIIIVLSFIFMILITLLKIKRMEKSNRRRVIRKFILFFAAVFIFNYILNCINVSDIDIIKHIINSLGVTLGFINTDIDFFKLN